MIDPKRITVTLPADMAGSVREAIARGDYASSSEIVREALGDWRRKRALRDLQVAVAAGVEDEAAGRTATYDPERIIRKARARPSAGD